ncbi:C2H2-type domain-containing protein [Mycena kentingensis (nom. inval.)]|nr:C2H2-type domain-containing protein [Mycena kentingensis (nom. inval.)]
MTTEDYTPSILVEAPSESNMLSSMTGYDTYPPSSEQSECYPRLFIQQPDSLSISTELDNYDKFRFSPATSGRSSPVGAWSPASTHSGEVFPDDFTHDEYSWAQSSLSDYSGSSPALSPSSLSPLFDGFGLADETYPASTDFSILNGPPAFSRLRSSSHSVPTSTELWADSGVGRGRSSSFSVSLWGAPETVSSPNVGSLAPGWRYPAPGRDGPAVDTQELSPPPLSPSLLTVPSPCGLRRRGAVSGSSRRTLSHSDIPALDQDLGRGRGIHRTTLSIPNSRSVSNAGSVYSHSRSPSRDSSYGGSSEFGYSPTMPPSPAFEDAEAQADLAMDEPIAIGRRRTFAAMRGPRESVPLARAISAPSVPSRSRRSRAAPARNTAVDELGLGMIKAENGANSSGFLYHQGTSSDHAEFQVAQSFKAEVASKKIRQASNARRLNAAAFACPLPTCSSTFTARHNLINHINSHNKHRPHKCPCGMAFTTQGVLNRHKKRCRK